MSTDLIEAEFLDELTQRAERGFAGKLHQAFVDWYIEAEYGEPKWDFGDDSGGGGIDAIVWSPSEVPPVVLVQSKFTEKIRGGALGARVYDELRSVVEAFRYGGEPFDAFLEGVRDDLKGKYRRAYELLTTVPNWHQKKKAFRLVSTHLGRPNEELD